MPGAWLIPLTRWIAREETFERMVSPAIADMQLEVSLGGSRWRHYLGLCLVLLHATLHDLRLDISVAFDRESRRVAWKRAGIWYVGSVAVFTFVQFWPDLPWALDADPGVWTAALTSAALKAVVTAPMIGIVPAVLYLYRRASSRRAVLVAVLIAGSVTISIALAVRPVRMLADQTLIAGAQSRIAPNNSGRASYLARDLEPHTMWWEAVQMGAWVFAYACVGVALAHGRSVARRVAGFLLTWIVFVAFLRELGPTPELSLTMERWRSIALVLSVAGAWLVYDVVSMWARRPARSEGA